MSIPGNVSIILAQVGQAERIAQEIQTQPEVQRQMAQQMAPELLRQQNAQVPVAEKGQGSKQIRGRKDGKGQPQGQQQRKRKSAPPAQDEEPDPGHEASPSWSGNIVNIKV